MYKNRIVFTPWYLVAENIPAWHASRVNEGSAIGDKENNMAYWYTNYSVCRVFTTLRQL